MSNNTQTATRRDDVEAILRRLDYSPAEIAQIRADVDTAPDLTAEQGQTLRDIFRGARKETRTA